ncbi:MAG: hypothetical protein QOE36_1526 [Gaiellaceae bacterium]|nr:hypothetical protein [Gaiellaceae bacterium]
MTALAPSPAKESPPVGIRGLPDPEAVLAAAERENFPVALRILPRRERRDLEAIYGYARLVDQIGDAAPGDRLALLDWLADDVARLYDGRAEHPLLQRLAPLVEHAAPPQKLFSDLVEANRRDQSVTSYETFDQLVDYCRYSANPVGRLVLYAFGAATPERLAASDSVCTALQLAEHWQDVAEDRRMGRIYLPADERSRFGVSRADLDASSAGESLRRLLAFEVDRARELLAPGVGLVRSLKGRQRLAIAGYVGGGHAALDAIAAAAFDPMAGAPKASKREQFLAARRVLREAR